MIRMIRYCIYAIFISCLLSSCTSSPYYQDTESIPGNAWDNNFRPTFKFEITDTNALYNIYFISRHTEAYPFSNIWVMMSIKEPGETSFKKFIRQEILLSEPSGKWLGRGMGEIYEQRWPIFPEDIFVKDGTEKIYSDARLKTDNDNRLSYFRKKGVYEVRFEQNMRVNPLPDILHVGLRIEKAGERNAAHK